MECTVVNIIFSYLCSKVYIVSIHWNSETVISIVHTKVKIKKKKEENKTFKMGTFRGKKDTITIWSHNDKFLYIACWKSFV